MTVGREPANRRVAVPNARAREREARTVGREPANRRVAVPNT